MPRAPAACASYPPPTAQLPIPTDDPVPPKSPSRLQLAQNMLTPRRRRTTLGSPSRTTNPALSPVKSYTNLRVTAPKPEPVPMMKRASLQPPRERLSAVGVGGVGGMIKLAARNTFRGRENEVVDWDRECDEGEMPSPFIRRRGVSRISAGTARG